MFMIIIVCMLLMVVITALLPLITGLAKYEKNPNYKKNKRQESNNDEISSKNNNYSKYIQSTGGYIPPDELNSNSNNNGDNNKDKDSNHESSKSFGTGVYNKLKDIQRDDLPVQLHLNVDGDKNSSSSSSGLRSRKNIKNLDAASSIDPNAYDYDLNDLIEEEIEDDRQERMSKRVNDYTSV